MVTQQRGFRNRLRIATSQSLHSFLRKTMARRYTMVFPQAYRTYSPWYEPEFRRDVFEPVRHRTAMGEERLCYLKQFVEHTIELEGDVAECGVYRGGSAHLIAGLLSAAHSEKTVHLFDTFEGMPETANQERDAHSSGDFGDTNLAAVQEYLAGFPRVAFHAGFIPQTFEELEGKRWSFVHVDVDLYSTTLDCLNFFYPRMTPGGVFVFDDYGHRIYERAEKQAVDEFFADRPEAPIVLRSGQAFVIKR